MNRLSTPDRVQILNALTEGGGINAASRITCKSKNTILKLLGDAGRACAMYQDVREFFNSADYVPPYTVFDVGGNNYRVVVIVRYRYGKVFVHKVMTHREYDDWNKLYRKGKV